METLRGGGGWAGRLRETLRGGGGWAGRLRDAGHPAETPMDAKIGEWWLRYMATGPEYSSVERSADGRRTYKVQRLTIRPGRMVCQEWASLVFNERAGVSAADPDVNAWIAERLPETGVIAQARSLMELVFALGTGAVVLRAEGVRDREASPDARIVAQRFDARRVIPLSWDESGCSEAAFVSTVTVRGVTLTQLQTHLKEESGYVVGTAFFDERGREVRPPGFSRRFETKSPAPLFALVKPGLENPHWAYGPFGASVLDDAAGAAALTDTAVDNMRRDIWLGQKLLFLDERLMDTDERGRVTVPRERDQQLFRKAEMDTGKLIEEYNPDLRAADNKLGIETGLALLSLRAGLGPGHFRLAPDGSARTATEVIAGNSALYRNLRKHQASVGPAIETVVRGALSLARTVRGERLPADPGPLRIDYDDSVIEDTSALRARDRSDVAAGLMLPWEYRVKWMGEDEETAKAAMETAGLPGAEY